ncbi:MAG: sulfotransferase [Candidatus Dadabacteria bacterium]|nr:MAG: sulfotransferase [Candidatus Dadabacteria bacterium]
MYTYWPTLLRIFRYSFSRRYCTWRYLLFPVPITLLILSVRVIVFVCQGLDYILFPRFVQQEVREPIFIMANPRSGTTFLHRLLAEDEQFTWLKLWHTLLPSITLYRLVGALTCVDRVIGRPLGRLFDGINRLAFGGWDGIHKTGLDQSEEDEQLWVYLFLTPGIMIFYPFIDKLPEALTPDELPERMRRRLVRYMRRAMQRHVYATGGKRLLAKNALAGGRLGIYREAFPDMVLIHTVRHPCETIPSAISMFSKPWRTHSPQCLDPDAELRNLVDIVVLNYHQLMQHRATFDPERYIEFRYDALVSDPWSVVQAVYDKFELECDDASRTRLHMLCEQARTYRSTHEYDLADFGLTAQEIAQLVPEVFAAWDFPLEPSDPQRAAAG